VREGGMDVDERDVEGRSAVGVLYG